MLIARVQATIRNFGRLQKKKQLDMIPIYGEYGKKWMKYD